MSDLRDAARQALKSLRGYRREISCEQSCDAERALEAALEQPEQERKLTDEVIADLWHQNGGFHHHFARALERWLKGQA
jgi:Sec-independent protein translocase protein TatA